MQNYFKISIMYRLCEEFMHMERLVQQLLQLMPWVKCSIGVGWLCFLIILQFIVLLQVKLQLFYFHDIIHC